MPQANPKKVGFFPNPQSGRTHIGQSNEVSASKALDDSKVNESLLAELKVQSVVLDGEIVCLNNAGKPEFRDLLFRRGEARFVAFDLLWCAGQDLRYSCRQRPRSKSRKIFRNP